VEVATVVGLTSTTTLLSECKGLSVPKLPHAESSSLIETKMSNWAKQWNATRRHDHKA